MPSIIVDGYDLYFSTDREEFGTRAFVHPQLDLINGTLYIDSGSDFSPIYLSESFLGAFQDRVRAALMGSIQSSPVLSFRDPSGDHYTVRAWDDSAPVLESPSEAPTTVEWAGHFPSFIIMYPTGWACFACTDDCPTCQMADLETTDTIPGTEESEEACPLCGS